MNWNEKIDLIKKNYNTNEFITPQSNRKNILRNIETKFIKRDPNYYDLNHFDDRSFNHWWDESYPYMIQSPKSELLPALMEHIEPDSMFWLGCDLGSQIHVYKSALKPALNLINIGQPRVNTYFLIELKYKWMLSLKFAGNQFQTIHKLASYH